VTSSATSAPIEGAEACAFAASTGFYSGCAHTDSAGHYRIGSLQPGSYKILFSAEALDYAPQFYSSRTTRSAANPVVVSSGVTTPSIDAALARGSHISGTVTVAGSGDPIKGAEVCALDISGEDGEHCVMSGPGGEYAIEGLLAGSFRVTFFAGQGEAEPGVFATRNFVKQYWHGRDSVAEAEAVTVGVGATADGIDASMREGGIVAGTVSDALTHAGLEAAEVCAFKAGVSEAFHCEQTGQGGHYVVAGLPTGSYEIGFTPPHGNPPHAGQYYSGKSTLAAADAVSVVEGSRTSGIDAALLELGTVSGHVSAAGGAALAGISACADPVGFEFGNLRCETTDAGGDYTIPGLAAGEYTIYFNGGLDHLGQYYDGQVSASKANRVSVSNGATTSGIDAELAPAGRITGLITDAVTHAALPSFEVCAARPGSSYFLGSFCANTNNNGEYTIGGLPGGSYRVYFESGSLNYLPQYYSGKETEAEATSVPVTVGATTGSIDAAMQRGAEISGTVTAASGHAPLEDIDVCVSDVGRSDCTPTGSGGKYVARGLPSGEYKVKFVPEASQNYVRQFYEGEATGKSADLVALTAGHATSGIDAQLQTGGKIAGTITDASSHDPLEGARVCVVGYEAPCGVSGPTGGYEIMGLPTGSFKVRFDPYEAAGYLQQYYHGKASTSEAEAVAVTVGSTTGAVDAAMVLGGSISGTVTDATSADGANLVQVCASAAGGSEYEHCAQTGSDGTYTIRGIEAGSYSVRFSSGHNEFEGGEEPNGNYVTQYYDGKASAGEAASVAVTDGSTTSGIDAAMHEGGRISGRVTVASGGAALSDAEVCIYTEGASEGEVSDCTRTDEEGEYAIEGLATGSYAVVFRPGFNPFEERNLLLQFYSGKSSPTAADPVVVTAGSTHEHVDAALATGGQITGHVTDASTAAAVRGAEACAIEAGSAGEVVSCGTTDALGDYTISGLPTGSYKVEFSDLRYEYDEEFFEEEEATVEEIYAREYWSHSSTAASAQPVGVVAGAATDGIDASLVRGGGSPGQRVLSVGFSGTGSGTVSSSPAGISCSASCAHGFAAGTDVTLTAAADVGSTFSGWSGACTGIGPCHVKLEGDLSVVAGFEAQPSAEAGGGSGEAGSGSGGGGATGSGAAAGSNSTALQPLRCKKGFVKKVVKGKAACVRKARHRHRKRQAEHSRG
jgi:hypothetical protein